MKPVLFFLFSSLSLSEIQQIDVTADSMSSLSVGHSLSSSMVITEAEIKAKNYRTVYEAIRSVPGVDVVNSSNGQPASVFIRGAKSEQTLVYVDGVEYNDLTDPGRSADLSVLQMDNVERIEILRGSQSIEYPGVGNVVLIFTKSGKNPLTQVYAEGGSFGTARGEISSRGNNADGLDYSFSASGYRTDGISSSATGEERDGASNIQFTTRLKKQVGSNSSFTFNARYFDAKSDLDLVPADTKDFGSSQQNFLGRVEGRTKVGSIEPMLAFSLRTITRNSLDYGSTPNTRFLATGDLERIESKNRLPLTSISELLFLGEMERQHVKTTADYGTGLLGLDRSVTQSALGVEYSLSDQEGFFGTLGTRLDYHSTFYTNPMARFAPAYRVGSDTVFRASIGNGFKAPSLYQLYGEFGESSLKPEKSWTVDLGVEQDFFEKRLHLTLTAFYSKFTDLVDYQFTSNKYVNVGKVLTSGLEYSQAVKFSEIIRLTSSYTYLHAKDEITELELARRPKHRFSNEVSAALGNVEVSLSHSFVGSRVDIDAITFTRKDVPSYNVFNLYSNWKAWESGTLFGRVENLLDAKYQAIDGYQSPGLSVFLGCKQVL